MKVAPKGQVPTPPKFSSETPPHTPPEDAGPPTHGGPEERNPCLKKYSTRCRKKTTTTTSYPRGPHSQPFASSPRGRPRPPATAHLFQAPRRRRGRRGSGTGPEERVAPAGMGSTAPPAGQEGQCGPTAAGFGKGELIVT
ncbi:uncharacterized protein LOC144577266 [Callithrix jacchus]